MNSNICRYQKELSRAITKYNLRRLIVLGLSRRSFFTLIVIFTLSHQSALASTVSYNFTGTVMEVTESELSSLGLAIAVGDSIMGTFSYDTSNATADGFPGNPNQGSYGFDVPPSSMSYTVGGYNYVAEDKQLGGFFPFPTNPESVVSVINDIGGRDILSVSSAATIGTTDVETNIRLFDFTENVFSDDSLPTAFSGQDFDLSFIATCSQCSRLTFSRVQDNFGFTAFRAQLDTLNAVPIPAAIWLFGTALIGLVGFSKRRKAAW